MFFFDSSVSVLRCGLRSFARNISRFKKSLHVGYRCAKIASKVMSSNAVNDDIMAGT